MQCEKSINSKGICENNETNEWLAQYRQTKGPFGQTRECPCYGAAEETTTHMFQCREPMMKETRDASFKTLKKYYQQHDIPAITYVPLVKLLWLSSNKNKMSMKESVSPSHGMQLKAKHHWELILHSKDTYLKNGTIHS